MPTDWESRYRAADTPWDKGAPHPALVRWLAAHPGRVTGDVLVPGCGNGHDVRAIAAAERFANVIGLDIAPAAVAAATHRAHSATVSFRCGDLFALPADLAGRFSWVWEHTCFCAIDVDRRDDYVAAVAAALRPDGLFLGVFYLDPYRGDHRPGGGPPHGCTRAELASRFEGCGAFRIVEARDPEATYPEREGRECLLLMERLPQRPD